jgi:hypothetical protein
MLFSCYIYSHVIFSGDPAAFYENQAMAHNAGNNTLWILQQQLEIFTNETFN